MTSYVGSTEPLMSALGDRARRMLIRHHIENKRIGLALSGMMYLDAGSQAAEETVPGMPRQEPSPRRTRAGLLLAGDVFKNQAQRICELRRPPASPI